MFGDREIHRKLSGAGGYAAERLAEISDSLGQLAKIMKNSGEDPGLSREDGIAGAGIGGINGLWELRQVRHEAGVPG